ncbi:hypothetical protein [Cohnella ginsengisoli]|uniref:hypothetical protein n=1 Tax=Cohnella ginsengisoli TaxID=425004 RepID=UPI0030B8DB8C
MPPEKHDRKYDVQHDRLVEDEPPARKRIGAHDRQGHRYEEPQDDIADRIAVADPQPIVFEYGPHGVELQTLRVKADLVADDMLRRADRDGSHVQEREHHGNRDGQQQQKVDDVEYADFSCSHHKLVSPTLRLATFVK